MSNAAVPGTSGANQGSYTRLQPGASVQTPTASGSAFAGEAAYLDDGEDESGSEQSWEPAEAVDGVMAKGGSSRIALAQPVATHASLALARVQRSGNYWETRLETVPDQSNIPKELRFTGASDKTFIPQLTAEKHTRSSARAARAAISVESREEHADVVLAAGILQSYSQATPSPEQAVRHTRTRSKLVTSTPTSSSMTGRERLPSMHFQNFDDLGGASYPVDSDGEGGSVVGVELMAGQKKRKAKGKSRMDSPAEKKPRLSQVKLLHGIPSSSETTEDQTATHEATPRLLSSSTLDTTITAAAPALKQIYESPEIFKQQCLAYSASILPGRVILPYVRRSGSLEMRCANIRTKRCGFTFNLNMKSSKKGGDQYTVTTARPEHNDACRKAPPDTKSRVREKKNYSNPVHSATSQPQNPYFIPYFNRTSGQYEAVAQTTPHDSNSDESHVDNGSDSDVNDRSRGGTFSSNTSVSIGDSSRLNNSAPPSSSTVGCEPSATLQTSGTNSQYSFDLRPASHGEDKEVSVETPEAMVLQKQRKAKGKHREEKELGDRKPRIPYGTLAQLPASFNKASRPQTFVRGASQIARPAPAASSSKLPSFMQSHQCCLALPNFTRIRTEARQPSAELSLSAVEPFEPDPVTQTSSSTGLTPFLASWYAQQAEPADSDKDLRTLRSLGISRTDAELFSRFGYVTLVDLHAKGIRKDEGRVKNNSEELQALLNYMSTVETGDAWGEKELDFVEQFVAIRRLTEYYDALNL